MILFEEHKDLAQRLGASSRKDSVKPLFRGNSTEYISRSSPSNHRAHPA